MATEVQKLIPGFTIDYQPCEVRSAIAESWPRSLDDTHARADWGWSYDISMYELAHKILDKVDAKYKQGKSLNMDGRITGGQAKPKNM